MNDELYHYGTPRHSGRYPWGSGDNPYQHESNFLKTVDRLKSEGMKETEIARYLNMSTNEFRQRKSLEKAEETAFYDGVITRLHNEGWSNVAIGEAIGKGESYVRYRLDPQVKERATKTEEVSNVLKDIVDKHKYVDIGEGSENMLNISKDRLKTAVKKLEDEGYSKYYMEIEQATNPGNKTSYQILCAPGVTWKEMRENRDKIALVNELVYPENNGTTIRGIEPPRSIDASRIFVRYAEDGGIDKDGVIEIRRGVEDLTLGNSSYAQARIAVNGTHYMKGMAIYSDNVPEGYDVVYNSHRSKGTPYFEKDAEHSETVFKKMKSDPENPFGSTLRMEEGRIVGQIHYTDKNGKEQLGAINIVRQEGDWQTWSKTLSAQFLAKQPKQLIDQQLTISYDRKKREFDEISRLTNPEVKRKLLDSFADDCDAAASHLKAASLPRQSSKVILPLTSLKDNEIYAPTYNNGEEVILIRYPHGGTFEIPRLIVNNNNREGKSLIGASAIDAVGINSKTAAKLSGADFDGDTVTVIPTRGQNLKSDDILDGLKGFDPQEAYPERPGMKYMSEKNKQNEMGRVSNLITDMTIQGATKPELARAVRHSMVVIDAEKHKLDYKRSEIENGIKDLKIKYQNGGGASTLISRAESEVYVLDRVEKTNKTMRTKEEQTWFDKNAKNYDSLSDDDKKKWDSINRKMSESEYSDYLQGKKIYLETEKTKTTYDRDKDGNIINVGETPVKIKSTRMRETDDAFTLSSGTPKEASYANYANKLKALANEARKEYISIVPSKYSPSAKETYANEVATLNSKLNVALKNKPAERKAQLLTDAYVASAKKDNPDMSNEDLKKLKTQTLSEFRRRVGASKFDTAIQITDNEWEAIQSGAISSSKLIQILNNTNMDRVRELATPRESIKLSASQVRSIKNMAANGNTIADIAEVLGLSTSTVSEYIKD